MRKRKQQYRNGGASFSPLDLQTLIHALGNSNKSFDQPLLLNNLYAFLLHLSSSHSCPVTATKLPFDFPHLCDALFTQLDNKFQHLFSTLSNVSSQQSQLLSSLTATSHEFTLLLRCCFAIMTLPQLDQNMVFDKGNFLLSVFKRLCSVDVIGVEPNEEIEFRRSLFQKSTSLTGLTSSVVAEDFIASLSFVKASDSCLPLLCALLEVFADEFLVHKSLRENLMVFDCLSSHDMLFVNHSRPGDVRNVMELIACHFILSFSKEQVCDSVVDRLSWHLRIDKRFPLLGLDQSISLLLDPTFLSAPEIFQAHLILMVSEAIGIGPGCMSTSPDVRLIDCYLLAFERSVTLYTRRIYALHVDGETLGISDPESCGQAKSLRASFDYFIRPVTRRHFDQLLSKLDDDWHSWSKNAALRTKAELVSTSFAYLKDNQELFVDMCKEKMISFIEALILVVSEEVTDTTSCEKIHASLPHMFLTASILKSMNASLLQALRCLEKIGKVGDSKLLKDFHRCDEYDFIVRVISSFHKLSDCLPMRRHPFVRDLLQGSKFKHGESKQMVMHFSCILSLGFQYKLEFLVEGCIFTLMTLLNLIIFEDGQLDALNPLLVYLSGASNGSFQGKLNESQAQSQLPSIKKTSHLVALKFQKIQTLFSSQSSQGPSTHIETENPNDEASTMHMNEETCSGEMYLNCLFENSKKPSDFDDLSDFIECKRGKDYSEMLKARGKYRKRKVQKMAILRWQKVKKTWQSIKGVKAHSEYDVCISSSISARNHAKCQ